MLLPALLVQLVFYLGLLLFDDYAGSLLAIILGSICLSVWLISLAVELIEPSRVSKTYFQAVLSGWLAPAAALLTYSLLHNGFDWLQL